MLAGTGAVSAQQAGGDEPPAIRARMDAAAKAGDLAAAAALAGQLVHATESAHVEALYAAAQFHARLGHREQAYLYLTRAIGAGFNDRGRLLDENAFADYRSDDLFKSLVRRAWARGYTDLLERPNREDVQRSPDIMQALAFRPGERVADIGAGTGYFTFQVADAVGAAGRVMALDIAPEMLDYLDLRVKARRATNVSLRRVAADDPRLEPGSVDTILMIDAIHYVQDRVTYAKKLLPALAPGGRVVIIDYRPRPMSERPWGPPPEQQFPREQMDREMEAAGFRVSAAHDFLPEQFFVIYVPRQ
jgi:SAM-dependent methyltransferase